MALFDQTNPRHDAGKRLRSILERERQALLEGRFDVLKSLEVKKENSLRALARNASLSDLRSIRDEFAHNQKMLKAAAKGIQSAHTIISQAKAERTPFSTYDAEGNRATPSDKAITLERRA